MGVVGRLGCFTRSYTELGTELHGEEIFGRFALASDPGSREAYMNLSVQLRAKLRETPCNPVRLLVAGPDVASEVRAC